MLIRKPVDPIPLREKAYDDLGEQIGRITKSLAYLQSNGVDIGPDGAEQVARCKIVKEKFKKVIL